MKKTLAATLLVSLLLPFATALPIGAVVAPNWNATGTYVIDMNYLGPNYAHDMVLTQDNMGNLTGNGGHPAGGPHTYTWVITSGTVSGDSIDFFANYTASADAVTPQTVLHVMGTIAQDGSMSGTWSDNYQGGTRAGTWMSTLGNAVAIPASTTAKVTIVKYIDGTMATAASAQSMSFPMSAAWTATNIGSGTGEYSLNATDATPYQAMTVDMTKGANYSTNEITGGPVVGANCDADQPYALVGYSTGDTLVEAQQAATSTTIPAFVNLQNDKFVIVKNMDCANTSNEGGEIGGNVVQSNGVLHVDSITMTKTTATANGTFADGWKYVFHITTPNNEPNLAMKFANWMSGANTIPVANNMRISSAQANNGGATITGDLNSGMDGRQVDVMVEVAVPTGTPTGSYTTTYGVSTNP